MAAKKKAAKKSTKQKDVARSHGPGKPPPKSK